jgi:hypothetical protein
MMLHRLLSLAHRIHSAAHTEVDMKMEVSSMSKWSAMENHRTHGYPVRIVPILVSMFSMLVPNLVEAAACSDIHMAICAGNAAVAPAMFSAVPVVKAIKDRGGFRDLGACEEWGRTVGMMVDGGLDSTVAGIIAGTCGECACRLAF